MRPLVLLPGVLLLAACSSGAKSEPELGPRSSVATATVVAGAGGGSMGMNMVNEAAAVGTAINGTVDATWSALQSVYISLEIPLTFREDAQKRLGNQAHKARRRIGSVPMIRAVDCGGESGMPNAETYDVTLEISSLVTPTPDGKARLQTLVQGSARRPSSGGTGDVRCTSLGGLEKKIAEMVSAILAGK
jgi:hypothetical protein